MSEADFNAILDTPAEQIVAKPPLPVGSYLFRVKSMKNVKSSQKQTPGVEFDCEAYEAKEDVDQEMLAAAGGLPRSMSHTCYVTEGAASMLKEFLEKCGIEPTGKTLREMLALAPNQSFMATVTHGTSKQGRAFAQIDQIFKID